ncbi:hypothetical protein Cpir12675_002607 [Ceratocystis pirilliformis]|uniref:Uncharacterized protein n=1 Tax=Ceratocystis pirilliformis TaxID=259994 RepID=A0ABR3Z8Q2_9PEZI
MTPPTFRDRPSSPPISAAVSTMSSQRPFFLSVIFAALRQTPNTLSAAASQNKTPGTSPSSYAVSTSATGAGRSIAANSASNSHSHNASGSTSSSPSGVASPIASQSAPSTQPPLAASTTPAASSSRMPARPLHTAAARGAAPTGIPIPAPSANRRRGSNSSSEGFRDVLGSDAWYIGGRTAGGEEQFFKLGVIRRVRSNDGLSLDRLSL